MYSLKVHWLTKIIIENLCEFLLVLVTVLYMGAIFASHLFIYSFQIAFNSLQQIHTKILSLAQLHIKRNISSKYIGRLRAKVILPQVIFKKSTKSNQENVQSSEVHHQSKWMFTNLCSSCWYVSVVIAQSFFPAVADCSFHRLHLATCSQSKNTEEEIT